MTSGTRQTAGLQPISTSCGPTPWGIVTTRSWSGGDSADLDSKSENPYSCDIVDRVEPLIKWGPNLQYTGTVSGCWGGYAGFPPLPPGALDLLRTKSLSRLLEGYKSHNFNLAVFLGELPESAKMIAGSAVSVFKAYRLVKKGRFGSAVDVLIEANREKGRIFKIDKSASSAWLALRYGWIPLLSDSYSACEAYESVVKAKPFGFTFRGRSKLVRRATSQYVAPESRITNKDQVILLTRTKPTTLQSLGFDDPLSVAWELLPFSFVVDWFYAVGTYLELRATLPSTQSKYIYTTTQKTFNHGQYRPEDRVSVPEYKYDLVSMRRTVSEVLIVPPPRIRNPFDIKEPLNRLSDALALIRQII